MKRQAYSIMAAVMLLAMGALLTTACDNEDNAAADSAVPTVAGQPIQFTATLAPKSGDGGAQTRAITKDKDGDNKEILKVAWEVGEEVAVYYQKADYTYATATATIQNVDSETGEATISATFDADAKDKGTANFVFPASLHNGSGDIDESQLLNNQNGLLRTGNKNISSISKNFDAATATGTIAVSGSKATISGTVAMQNRVCILKMALGFDDGQSHTSIAPLQGGNTLTIFVEDGPTYTITSAFEDTGATSTGSGSTATRPFQQGDVIYVAMLPVASKTVFFSSIASGGIYRKFSTGVTLEDGKFYRNVDVLLSTSTLMPEGYKDLSSGSITAVDGDRIFQSNSAATANTITIADGATVTLNGVNISTTGPGIICNDDATIILKGTNSVTSTDNTAVQIGLGPTTLTISGSGSLTATGGGGAGIGSSREEGERGNIVINGGTVTAIGGVGAAGIGSIDGYDDVGYSYSCGNIFINGGTVTAFGGENGAGIGGGGRMSCGNIFINGGTVTATGGSSCAGIGSGLFASCGDITITDGVTRVEATIGTDASYSIGMAKEGHQRSTGTITIGGTVYYDGEAFQNGGDAYLATSPLVYTP